MAKKNKDSLQLEEGPIIIDEDKGLVFNSEDELYVHFAKPIQELEKEFRSQYKPDEDFKEEEFTNFEGCLSQALEDPDEIWEDKDSLRDLALTVFIAEFEVDDQAFYYVALAYVGQAGHSFVFIHFPTKKESMVDFYKRGRRIYERSSYGENLAMGEDALTSGDDYAKGLFDAMLKLRASTDIQFDDFEDYLAFREETIENADEIWRKTDSQGHVLVTFIKEFDDPEGPFHYMAIALEEDVSESHYLLFSFPTRDKGLVERYKQGENLDSEDFVREESH